MCLIRGFGSSFVWFRQLFVVFSYRVHLCRDARSFVRCRVQQQTVDLGRKTSLPSYRIHWQQLKVNRILNSKSFFPFLMRPEVLVDAVARVHGPTSEDIRMSGCHSEQRQSRGNPTVIAKATVEFKQSSFKAGRWVACSNVGRSR